MNILWRGFFINCPVSFSNLKPPKHVRFGAVFSDAQAAGSARNPGEGLTVTWMPCPHRPPISGLLPMSAPEPDSPKRSFRQTLLMVMAVQVFTLLLLWLLQLRYHV